MKNYIVNIRQDRRTLKRRAVVNPYDAHIRDDKKVELYDIDGGKIIDSTKIGYAKKITYDENKQVEYLVPYYDGELLDIREKYDYDQLKFKKTGEKAFTQYLKFLKTKKQFHYTFSMRNVDNDR